MLKNTNLTKKRNYFKNLNADNATSIQVFEQELISNRGIQLKSLNTRWRHLSTSMAWFKVYTNFF